VADACHYVTKMSPNVSVSKITKKEILELLKNTGYLMEQEVSYEIDSFGYVTDTNYHYKDPDDGTSREMDVRGYTMKKISHSWHSYNFHYLDITLIIGCKNNKLPLIFFSKKSIVPSEYSSGDFFVLSNPNKVPGKEGVPIDILDFINLRKFHHYYKASAISTQFCETYLKNDKSIDVIHEAYKSEILPVIKAMDYEMKIVRKQLSKDSINMHTFYPIIVLSGEMYTCDTGLDKKPKLKKTQHVSYLQTYDSKTLKGEFRIDIITQNYLNKFLSQLDNETNKIVKRLKDKRETLLKTIKAVNKK
jgi:hypothetical protein